MPRDDEKKEQKRRERLSASDRSRELLPLRRADQLKRCELYWLPVNTFPAPGVQREWLLSFMERFSIWLAEEHGLRGETFVQYKSTLEDPLRDAMLKTMEKFMPMLGMSRRPGTKPPPPASLKDVEPLKKGDKSFRMDDFVADYCYWFVDKSAKEQRELFAAHGALTTIYLEPDENAQPPEIPDMKILREHELNAKYDLRGFIKNTYAMKDSFQEKSVQLFGEDLKDDHRHSKMPFVLPFLTTQDLFGRPDEECEKWFELCQVYVNESPADKGILIASSLDMEEGLIGLLAEMRAEGLSYPMG